MLRKSFAVLGAVLTLATASTASAQTCVQTVLPGNGSTSGNARAPITRFRFERSVYLITPAEMAAAGYSNGAIPTTIGWNYSTAPTVSGAAPLNVYLENTADTTNLKSTTWATAISTMTLVHSASTTLPAAAGPFDITLTGGSPFTYTGGGLYVAFDWGNYTGTLDTVVIVGCTNTLTNGLLGAQSNTAAPTTLAASAFRPETRLNGGSPLNDVGVTQVYSFGSLPSCIVGPQVVKAVVTNSGFNAQTNVPVTLNVTGSNTFTDTQTVASLAGCGGQATVTFLSFSPSVLGSNTVAVSVPADDFNSNNSLSKALNTTNNTYSYKIPGSTSGGGVGFTGGSGVFVAKFTTTGPDTITDVQLEFFAVTATTYKVAIYGDNAGVPSTTALYVDATDRTVTAAGPVTITLPSPVAVGPGAFYVGVQQTNTTNANYSFDSEAPVRAGSFFFTATIPPVTWGDFSPGTNFKLNIGYLGTACAVAPCPADITGDHTVGVADLLAVIGAWGPCPAPPALCPADINHDGTVGVADLLTVIAAWGPCP